MRVCLCDCFIILVKCAGFKLHFEVLLGGELGCFLLTVRFCTYFSKSS